MNLNFLSFLSFVHGVVEESVPDISVPEVNTGGALPSDMTIIDLVLGSGLVVQGVLILLILMSVITWGIIISKGKQMAAAKKESNQFEDAFWTTRNLSQITEVSNRLKNSPLASVFSSAYRELMLVIADKKENDAVSLSAGLDNINRALMRGKADEINRLEAGTTFLATTASAAPFIGLFGTVWGIMNAFIGLSHAKSSSIQAVAPGISEALIATAIGLAAAIPAAIAYNFFQQQVRIFSRSMDRFSAEFLNIARRHFLK